MRSAAAVLTLALPGALLGAWASDAAAPARPVPQIAGCPVFTPSDAFNRDVSALPVHARSADWVRSIGTSRRLHPDFGSGSFGNYGIPITVAARGQRRVPVRYDAYGAESDPGPFPIPPAARIEGGSDRHVLVVQRGTCRLVELYGARRAGAGWVAESGATWSLRAPRARPAGWTSADAAGLPILPGLARPDEASSTAIRHALRFTVPRTQRAYLAPARHAASRDADPALPPMGARLRLKAGYPLTGLRGQARAIAVALKRYGMIVADNGSPWFVSGAADRRWDDAEIDALKTIPGTAFEAVDTGARLVRVR